MYTATGTRARPRKMMRAESLLFLQKPSPLLNPPQPSQRGPLRPPEEKIPPPPLPPPPLASRVPSGLQATLATRPRCFCSFVRSVPAEVCHRHTLPSSPQLAGRVPSGLHATLRILAGASV